MTPQSLTQKDLTLCW